MEKIREDFISLRCQNQSRKRKLDSSNVSDKHQSEHFESETLCMCQDQTAIGPGGKEDQKKESLPSNDDQKEPSTSSDGQCGPLPGSSKSWLNSFSARSGSEVPRNCSKVDRDVKDMIIQKVTDSLLSTTNVIQLEDGRSWNKGGNNFRLLYVYLW